MPKSRVLQIITPPIHVTICYLSSVFLRCYYSVFRMALSLMVVSPSSPCSALLLPVMRLVPGSPPPPPPPLPCIGSSSTVDGCLTAGHSHLTTGVTFHRGLWLSPSAVLHHSILLSYFIALFTSDILFVFYPDSHATSWALWKWNVFLCFLRPCVLSMGDLIPKGQKLVLGEAKKTPSNITF